MGGRLVVCSWIRLLTSAATLAPALRHELQNSNPTGMLVALMAKTWFLIGLAVAFAQNLCNAATGYYLSNAFPMLTWTNPVCLASPPGETNRLFVVEKRGRMVV